MTGAREKASFGLGFTLRDAAALADSRGAGCRIGFHRTADVDILAGFEPHITAAAVTEALAIGAPGYFLSFGNQLTPPDLPALAPVLDQLATASGLGFMAVCFANPVWGRTAYQGHVFQDGKLQAELVAALRTSLSGRAAVVPHEVVAQGAAALRARLTSLKEQGVMLALVDALDEADCLTVSACFAALPLAGGPAWLAPNAEGQGPELPCGPIAILAAASDRQTLFQLGAARAALPFLQLGNPEDAIAWGNAQTQNFIISAAAAPDRHGLPASADAALAAVAAGLHACKFVLAGADAAILASLGVQTLTAAAPAAGLRWLQSKDHAILIKPDGFGPKNLFLDGFEPQIRLNAAAE